MGKYESKSKKIRIKKILHILRCEQPFHSSKIEPVKDAYCPIYHMPCHYPQETHHLSCLFCGGVLAIPKKVLKEVL